MSDTQHGERCGVQYELWVASTRSRFDYHEGPYPDQQAAMAAAEENAREPLDWSPEPDGVAATADTHGWMFRVCPIDEAGGSTP